MKRYIKKIVSHPFFAGSAIMIIGSNLANFFASIYRIILVRFLTLPLYGDLAAVISVIALLAAMFGFMNLVVVKFVSQGKNKKELKQIFGWFFKVSASIGVVLLVLLSLLSPVVSNFIHVGVPIVLLIGPILFITFIGAVFKSFLQGLLKFGQYTLITNIELIGRVVFGVGLVAAGLGVFGAVAGIFLSIFLSTMIIWFLLSEYRQGLRLRDSFRGGREIIKYTAPVFLFSLASTSFLTTDVILVKHFLTSTDAAFYDSLSTVGKIILYASGPVATVMFPMISKKNARGEKYFDIFILSLILTTLLSIGVLIFYFFFPSIPVGILYGQKFLVISDKLIWFGLFAAIFSLCSLIVSLYLSLGKTKVVWLVALFALLQIGGIYFFHDSILTVVKVNLASASFLLISLIIYLGYERSLSFNRSSSI